MGKLDSILLLKASPICSDLYIYRLWHRCGEGCSSGSSLPVDCDPAYGTGAHAPREVPPAGQGTVGVSNQSQLQPGGGEGDMSQYATATGHPITPSLVDNVPGGAQIQRGGSLPNPVVSSMLGNNQSGPGGRASSLSSSQASRSPAAPATHTTTASAVNALIWKMNERGPTGLHTPAALASLAELLANPAGVSGSQVTNLASPLSGSGIPQSIPMQTLNCAQHVLKSVQHNQSTEQKSEDQATTARKAKVIHLIFKICLQIYPPLYNLV